MTGRGGIVAALAAAAACILAAAMLMPRIQAQRAELSLTVSPDVLQNMPPDIAFTQAALGSFRGLAVDYLWIRLQGLKEAGRYYEAMELSRLIVRLQPRFISVWDFHAWNMAYNISDAVRTPEEKWLWVQEGIRLLRDEGIPLNPAAPKLYEQLAYTFFHRIGKYSNLTQDYFKLRHATEWHALLGEMPKGSVAAAVAWLQPLAEAPASWDELARREPGVAALADEARALGLKLDREFLRQIAFLEAGAELTDAQGVVAGQREGFKLTESGARLRELWRKASSGRAWRALLGFLRAQALRDEYHMDPAFMLELTQTFGPLDWRHPAAHTVYWSLLGARRSQRRQGVDLYALMSADRMVVNGLKDLAFGGSVSFDLLSGYYNLVPEPLLLDAYEKAFMEAQGRLERNEQYRDALAENHRGFLLQAVQVAYCYGSQALAEHFYAKLRNEFPTRGNYARPLDEFVAEELVRGLDRLETAGPAIQGFAFRAFEEGLAGGRRETAERLLGFSKQIYDRFQRQQRALGSDFVKQTLPPYEGMLNDTFAQFMLDGTRPHVVRARVWARAPSSLKQGTFDKLKGPLYEDARRQSVNPEHAYPEPAGMEAYRNLRRPAP